MATDTIVTVWEQRGQKELKLTMQELSGLAGEVESSFKGMGDATSSAARGLKDLGSTNLKRLTTSAAQITRLSTAVNTLGASSGSIGAISSSLDILGAKMGVVGQNAQLAQSNFASINRSLGGKGLSSANIERISKVDFSRLEARLSRVIGRLSQLNDVAIQARISLASLGAMKMPQGGTLIPRNIPSGAPGRIGVGGSGVGMGLGMGMGGMNIGQMLGFGTAALGIRSIATGIVDATGRLQQAEIGLGQVLGDDKLGAQFVQWAREFAKDTPYDFATTIKGTQQLAAMGEEASTIPETMRILGDSMAALGGNSESFGRVVFNLGQIRTQGKVTTRELRDFAMNGLPVFEILRDKLKLTAKDMERIGDAGISADVGLKAIMEGLEERFGGMMEKSMGKWPQQINQLKDNWEELFAEMGKGSNTAFTTVVKSFSGIASTMTALEKSVGGVTKGLAVLAGVALIRGRGAIARGGGGLIEFMLGMPVRDLRNLPRRLRALSRLPLLMRNPLSGAAQGALSRIPGLGNIPALGGIGGRGAAITATGAGASAMLSAAVYREVSGNLRVLGASEAKAQGAAIATAVGAGMLALFVPGAAIPIAIATAFSWGLNKVFNERREREAEGAISTSEAQEVSKMSRRERSEFYFRKAAEMDEAGDATQAMSFRMMANRERRWAGQDEERERSRAYWQADRERRAARLEEERFDRLVSQPGASFTKNRNDAWTVEMNFPTSNGDIQARNASYNAATPMPAGLY